MVVISTQRPADKVMAEDGLVHRFVTIIGHHHPGARRQPSGIVSPAKKPGSPPPHSSVIRVGAFDEHIQYRHVTDSVWIYLESKPVGGDRESAQDIRYPPIESLGRQHIINVGLISCLNGHHARDVIFAGIHSHQQDERNVEWNRNIEAISAILSRDVQRIITDRPIRVTPMGDAGKRSGKNRIGEKINPLHDSPCRDCRAHPSG